MKEDVKMACCYARNGMCTKFEPFPCIDNIFGNVEDDISTDECKELLKQAFLRGSIILNIIITGTGSTMGGNGID